MLNYEVGTTVVLVVDKGPYPYHGIRNIPAGTKVKLTSIHPGIRGL